MDLGAGRLTGSREPAAPPGSVDGAHGVRGGVSLDLDGICRRPPFEAILRAMRPVDHPAERGWRVVEERHRTPVGAWRIVLALPEDPRLHPVEAVWASEGIDCFQGEEILPRSRTEVLFCLGGRHWLRDRETPERDRAFERTFVSGLQRGPLLVESPSAPTMAGVRLRPEGVAAFLRDTPSSIAEAVVDLDDILGSAIDRLRDQVASTSDLRVRTLLLAAAVARHLDSAPGASDAVRGALHAVHSSRGTVPIRELVRTSGHSHRWLTERFRSEVGMTPKTYSRLVRFESAFERLGSLESVHWGELALDAGYYDQAHLARDFRELAGTTPTEVFRRRAPDGLGLLLEDDVKIPRSVPASTSS